MSATKGMRQWRGSVEFGAATCRPLSGRGGLGPMEEIVRRVDQQDGAHICSMRSLRDAVGAGRLGSRVRDRIARMLDAFAIQMLPGGGVRNQNEWVLLYQKDTPLGGRIDSLAQ